LQAEQEKSKKAADEQAKLEHKRLQEVREAEVKSMKDKERQLKKDEDEARDNLKAAHTIIKEASIKLTTAVTSNDLQQIKIAQMVLEQGEKKMSDAAAHASQKRLLSHRPSSEPQCSEPKKKMST